MDRQAVIEATRRWIASVVIGLNLCPFARAVQAKAQIRYVYSGAHDEETLLATLRDEMDALVTADPGAVDTTLIVHPLVLNGFLDFNDFLDLADQLLEQLGYDGVLQVASFHPQFQFAGTRPGDLGNATNQSPYPTLHLLRESSVDRAVAAFPDAATIFEKNIHTLESLGSEGLAALHRQVRADAAETLVLPSGSNAEK